MNKTKVSVFVSLMLACFFWGMSFIWVKEALNTFEPMTIVTIRLILSSIFLLALSLIMNKFEKIKKKDLHIFIYLTLSEPVFYFLGETNGLKLVSSTLASLIISTIPLFIPIAAYIFIKVKISTYNLVGLIISMLGVMLIIINNSFQITASPLGILLVFVGVFSAVSYTLILKGLSEKYNPFTIVTYQNMFGLVAFIPLFLIYDYKTFVTINFNFDIFIPLIYLSVLPSSLSYMLYTYGVMKIGVNKSSMFANTIPIFTALWAYFFLSEDFTMRKVIGTIIVLAGLIISQIEVVKRKL